AMGTFKSNVARTVRPTWKGRTYNVRMPAGDYTIVDDDAKRPPIDVYRRTIQRSTYDTLFSVDATDAAIRLADEHGLDLNEIEGSGHDGRITINDVQANLDSENE